MSISIWKNQSGNYYAYECIPHYDASKKQSRPKKVYLGRVNPATGEIIKTAGKRGRPRKDDKSAEEVEPERDNEAPDYKKLYSETVANLKVLKARVIEQQETICQLNIELAEERARAGKLGAFIKRFCEQAQGLSNS